VKAKATKTKAEAVTPKKKAAGKKRKAADDTEGEDHECDSHNEAEPDEKEKPAPKKRKTKKDKEAEAMPLAQRTAVSSLKRAMYIGAHVSGAGGEYHMFLVHNPLLDAHILTQPPVQRLPKLHPKRRPHRCQLIRPLPQVPAEMGLPSPQGRGPRRLPRRSKGAQVRPRRARPPARLLPGQPRAGGQGQGGPGLRQLR
jgi:hypothetical protein